MKLVTIHNKTVNVPEAWNELSQKQLIQIMDHLFIKKQSPEVMLLQLLRILLGLSENQFRKVSIYEIDEFLYLVKFITGGPIQLTKNLLPEYRHLTSIGAEYMFYGPSDGCNNLVMKEFIFSESYFTEWFDNKEDHELLDDLVAVLYREGKPNYDHERNPDGDPRLAFNQNISCFNAKRYIRLWPRSVKLAIAYYYSSCRQQFVESNPKVFEGGDGEAAQYGLVEIMRNVAKDGTYGSFEQVEEKYVDLILMELNIVVSEAEKIKRLSKTS